MAFSRCSFLILDFNLFNEGEELSLPGGELLKNFSTIPLQYSLSGTCFEVTRHIPRLTSHHNLNSYGTEFYLMAEFRPLDCSLRDHLRFFPLDLLVETRVEKGSRHKLRRGNGLVTLFLSPRFSPALEVLGPEIL